MRSLIILVLTAVKWLAVGFASVSGVMLLYFFARGARLILEHDGWVPFFLMCFSAIAVGLGIAMLLDNREQR